MLFMIHILMTIVPIWKSGLIRTRLLSRCYVFFSFTHFFLLRHDLEGFIIHSIGSRQLHSVWIDYLMLFFWIECLLLRDDSRLVVLLVIFLLVIGDHSLRVWILHKSIWTSCSSAYWLAIQRIYITNISQTLLNFKMTYMYLRNH